MGRGQKGSARRLLALKLGLGVLVGLALALAGFGLWGNTPARPLPEALAALTSQPGMEVTTEPWLTFRPTASAPTVGLIFYPGARVDPRAYAPAARAIAAEGYLVVIVPMPLNFAIFGAGRAAEVMAAYPEIQAWAIGGHSLGGAMAARFVYQHPQAVQGLVLWAAYPASSDDLSGWGGVVSSISGTLDGLATPAKIAASRPLLPPTTRWVSIEGGNHAQFGWYGDQAGDQPATLDREAQQAQIVAATVLVLGALR